MSKLWFKRKWLGWGWRPVSFEGWLVVSIYVVLMVYFGRRSDIYSHSGSDTLISFALPFIVFTSILIAICYAKGEKPRWQWWGDYKSQKDE